ncbi:hypothetical protein CFP56_020245 [Quercus suber]|uniref:PHL domain-containing protein n=1 Tax=Quercus suber TaxID=58331 RepID=A0AAW0KG74_QUESU
MFDVFHLILMFHLASADNTASHRVRARMIMSEKPCGTVAMHYGEIEDGDYLSVEDYLPTLPNTHLADLLATQLCSLMIHEGYHVDDQIRTKPIRMNLASGSQSNAAGVLHNSVAEMQQYPEAVSGGLGNAMGMGTARGIGTGMSAPMAPISGIGNVGQKPMTLSQVSNITSAISQQLRPGLNQHAALMARMAQNRANMLGGPQSGLAGISAARQIHPGSSDACPASPQLSSQTLGSVSSIAHSPMDLQGVNKGNSVSNA